MKPRKVLFLAALDLARQTIEESMTALRNEADSADTITDLDDALEALLDARNAYCKEDGIIIEDGSLGWNRSELQNKQDEEEAA